jgi:hypothetical protein
MAQETSHYTDADDLSLRKIEKDTSFSLGQYGATYLMGDEGVTVPSQTFGAIQALEDSEVEVVVTNWTGAENVALSSTVVLPLKIGVTIFGNFTQVYNNFGKVVAYRNA